MKQISEELTVRLSGEVVTLCLCWKLSRADGYVLGLTEHDQALEVDGVTYGPGAAVGAGTFTQTADLKPGRAAAAGMLASDAIRADEIDAGLWDRCKVDVYRADWQRPDLGGIPIWTGFLSEISRSENGAFEAELVSLKAELERPVGRVLTRDCDAVLGDARCGASVDGRTCDQRFETCRDTFGNAENFRGFPHMPGIYYCSAWGWAIQQSIAPFYRRRGGSYMPIGGDQFVRHGLCRGGKGASRRRFGFQILSLTRNARRRDQG
jgi:hypothetical protein